jgi:hypothetical protein
MSVTTITPRELEAMRLRGSPVELLDVRTPVEYREVHAEPARLVPLERLDPKEVMEARHGTIIAHRRRRRGRGIGGRPRPPPGRRRLHRPVRAWAGVAMDAPGEADAIQR